MTAAPAADLLGAAMVDFAVGRQAPAWLRVAPGRRLTHDLAAYFAPVTAHERALLDLAEGPVLDVGCGPARHARLLQARGLTAIGLDRSLLALGLARSLGLRHWLHADARSGPLPAVRTALLLDGNLGLAGTPAGAARLLHRLATACGPGGRLLVSGRAPRHGWLRPLVLRDEYRDLVGPWGRWLQASLPAVLDLATPAGWRLQHAITEGALLGRPLPRPSMTGLPGRLRRRRGDPVRPLVASPVSLGPVSRRVGPLAAVLLLLAAAVCGCSTADRLGEYKAARTLHLAPDGRLVVTDQGSGRHDGAVMAVDPVSGTQTVLLRGLPSTRNSGQAHADLAGPSGAAMAPDGTVCAVIGDATTRNAGFATLRCTDGLVVDLEALQAKSRLRAIPTTSSQMAAKAGTSATPRPTTCCTSTGQARSWSWPASQASPPPDWAAATAKVSQPG